MRMNAGQLISSRNWDDLAKISSVITTLYHIYYQREFLCIQKRSPDPNDNEVGSVNTADQFQILMRLCKRGHRIWNITLEKSRFDVEGLLSPKSSYLAITPRLYISSM